MSYSDSFARQFSRLVTLLIYESEAPEEQRGLLRGLAASSVDGPVSLGVREGQLVVNGMPHPTTLLNVLEFAQRLASHGATEISFEQGTTADTIFATARVIASEPVPGDGPAALRAGLALSDVTGVRVDGDRARPGAGLDDIELDLGDMELVAEPPRRKSRPSRASGTTGRKSGRKSVPEIFTADNTGAYLTFAAVARTPASVAAIFARIDAEESPNAVARCLNELLAIGPTAAAEGARIVVLDALYGIVKREPAVSSRDIALAYTLTFREMATLPVLRAVAELLTIAPDRREQVIAVLGRAGENGVAVVLDQLATADGRSARRTLFDAAIALRPSVAVLCHMLADSRWYVARNAADLLAELADPASDEALIRAQQHPEERVRASVAAALTRLATPRSLEALRTAVRDTSPRVRTPAVAGLAVRKEPRATGMLIRALGDEEDAEVQVAIVSALGHLATPEAVERLIEAAKPSGLLERRKSPAYRAAAAQALGAAHTPAARAALAGLVNDRERDVRAAATRAIAQQDQEQQKQQRASG